MQAWSACSQSPPPRKESPCKQQFAQVRRCEKSAADTIQSRRAWRRIRPIRQHGRARRSFRRALPSCYLHRPGIICGTSGAGPRLIRNDFERRLSTSSCVVLNSPMIHSAVATHSASCEWWQNKSNRCSTIPARSALFVNAISLNKVCDVRRAPAVRVAQEIHEQVRSPYPATSGNFSAHL